MVHFGLQTADGEDNQEVEEVLQPGDFTEKRREAGHLTAFLLNLLAQIEPICQRTARFVVKRQNNSREIVNIEQRELFWLREDLPQTIFQFNSSFNESHSDRVTILCWN